MEDNAKITILRGTLGQINQTLLLLDKLETLSGHSPMYSEIIAMIELTMEITKPE